MLRSQNVEAYSFWISAQYLGTASASCLVHEMAYWTLSSYHLNPVHAVNFRQELVLENATWRSLKVLEFQYQNIVGRTLCPLLLEKLFGVCKVFTPGTVYCYYIGCFLIFSEQLSLIQLQIPTWAAAVTTSSMLSKVSSEHHTSLLL